MNYDIKLRPIHYASVSGGKDSFYMLNLILNNLDKYPLDMVVNFELEIDWKWSRKVIDFMEERCKANNIKFVKVKPRVTWEELYDKYGFPLAHARWCNSEYKLDCKKQLNEWILSQNCRPLAYIGFCADETKRFKYELGDWKNQDVCYPLAEEGIEEYQILEWAKNQPIFENYYKYFSRQGCRICPFMTMKEMAYLYITDKESFDYMFKCIKETENKIFLKKGKKYLFRGEGADIIKERVISKWVNQINYEKNQYTIYDFLK
jgi:3'-phosphoadenosine 5'-phosphosulfate sulfotransferase (PAPS reductase)/FAD synthetase